MNADFIEIDNIAVNTEIMDICFTCDLVKCKGACCTMESEFGAPLTEDEIKTIDKVLPIVNEYLPQRSVKAIEKKGFWFETPIPMIGSLLAQ